MNSLFDSYNYIIRLDRGERLSEGLASFFGQNDASGGWISAVGGATEVELGFYHLDKRQYQWQTITKTLEITNLQGTIALDEHGKPTFHLHGTFSDDQLQTIGGHVKDLIVGGTCEIFVHRSYQPWHRKYNDAVGLNTLDL